MYKYSFLILFFILFNINNSFSQDKTAFIDLEIVLKNSNYGKSLLKDLEELNKKNIEELKIKESELKKNEDDLMRKQNIISKDEFDKEISLLKSKIEKYRKEKNQMVTSFEKKRKEVFNNFFSKVNPIIQIYMDENSIDILLERKNVFIGKNNSDITEIIIKKINNELKN